MKTANNTNEAMQFFMSNSEGSVKCVKEDGSEKVCDSYPEAVEFFS